jgi:NitT/TauT family transport system substrate-binding protein
MLDFHNRASVARRLLACATLAVALATTSTAAGARTHVVIGTASGYADSSAAVLLAVDRGYYKDAGIDVEVIDFQGGSKVVQALAGGGIQYAIVAPEHVVRMRNRGLDGSVAVALDNRLLHALVVKNDSPVRSFADLRGRRVGITAPGSLTESLVRLEAQREHLDPDRDFEIINSGVGASMKAALDTDRIAAGMFANLDAERLLKQGYRIVFDWRTQRIPTLALASTVKWQSQHADAARAFAAATVRAQRELLDDPKLAAQVLRKIYPNLEAGIIDVDVASLPSRLSRDGIFDRDSIAALQANLLQLEPDLKPVAYEDVMPTRYLK